MAQKNTNWWFENFLKIADFFKDQFSQYLTRNTTVSAPIGVYNIKIMQNP